MENDTTGMVNWLAGAIVAAAVAVAAVAYGNAAVEPEPVWLDVQGVPVTIDDADTGDGEEVAPTFETFEFGQSSEQGASGD